MVLWDYERQRIEESDQRVLDWVSTVFESFWDTFVKFWNGR